MSGDFGRPTGSSLRTAFMQEIRDIISDVAKMVYSGTSNIPSGTIRLNETTHLFEKYNGSTWDVVDLTGLSVGGLNGKKLLFGSVSWSPGTLASLSQRDNAFTVTGAQTGDDIIVTPPGIAQPCILVGYVTSTNGVTLRFYNQSSTTQTLPSGTYKVIVITAL